MMHNRQMKIIEFQKAIEKYNSNLIYNKLGVVVAFAVISLQLISLYNLYCAYINLDYLNGLGAFIIFFISYLLTDFINGFIHLYMDNNSNYESCVGPLIAAFHLHHKKPTYKKRAILRVYFQESGAKCWLPFYLLMIIYFQLHMNISFYTNLCLVLIGVLSSVAEVSHYWCHNSSSENKLLSFFQKYRILLSKEHHKYHHMHDNVNYAFLNGATDIVLNLIAKNFFGGYKNRTDLHVKAYDGLGTTNRD